MSETSTPASPPAFELTEDSLGKLTLARPGHDAVADIRIRRAFPWSLADQFISLRSSDGKELVLIEDLSTLSAPQRALIERQLDRNTFLPLIQHIDALDVRFGYQEWRVRTDRGSAQFRVLEREDLRFMPDGRFAIKDADGNIYCLPRLDALDPHSQRMIEALL